MGQNLQVAFWRFGIFKQAVASINNCPIRMCYGENVKINIFPAIPNPIAFEIGRTIMKNIDPTIILYDKVNDSIEYRPVMTLHERVRQ